MDKKTYLCFDLLKVVGNGSLLDVFSPILEPGSSAR